VPQKDINGSRVKTETLSGKNVLKLFAKDASGAFGFDSQNVWVDYTAFASMLKQPLHGLQDIHSSLSWLQ
jgi:hypothetical protein